jgi:hypothetical protein
MQDTDRLSGNAKTGVVLEDVRFIMGGDLLHV